MAFQPPFSLTTNPLKLCSSSVCASSISSISVVKQSKIHRSHIHPTSCTSSSASTDSTSEETTLKSNDDDSNNIEPPPNTFYQAITQAQNAVNSALARNETLLEVEFPPLPTSELESPSVGSYEVSTANLRLVIDFAKKYASENKNVVIAVPDRIEKDRIEEQYNGFNFKNIRLTCLKNTRSGLFIELLWSKPEIDVAINKNEDDMYIILGPSCQELPDVENLIHNINSSDSNVSKPIIFFNLKLDSARGDLGLPAFPRKTLHYRFLSKILPVYYLRTRTYSRSLNRPPYIINYSGALFRCFPGPYQVLLDTSAGSYRRLKTLNERPPLGEVRDMLTDGMNLEKKSSKEQKEKSFLYRGYKSRTWWEEDRTKAESNKWRS